MGRGNGVLVLQTPYERRVNSPLDGPIIRFEAELYFCATSFLEHSWDTP